MYTTDGTTFINATGIAALLLMGLLMLALPRRQALLPVVVLICFMTMGQRLMVFGLNFTLIRVLLVFGAVRVFSRGEARLRGVDPVDRAMLWYVASGIVAYTLLWQTGEAFMNRLGMAYDALGLYFLFRVLVRDADDLRTVLRQLAWCAIPLALLMLVEKHTGRNPFAALGGVPPETIVRDGLLRCQGPFAHPILAGVFGSGLVPLFLGLRAQRSPQRPGDGRLALAGLAAAGVIVICAGSSGPLLAAVIGAFAWFLFPLRDHMRAVRRGLLALVVVLHLSMQAPVWFLLARMTVFDGSTGWHRSILIDDAIHHFGDWWLIGTYTTANWGFYMFDVTNNYIAIAVQGGLLTLVLFVLVISRAFASAGLAQRAWGDAHPAEQRLAWALGSALLVHVVNYVSVVYFDQNIVVWYLLLAMLATLRHLVPAAPGPAPAAARRGSLSARTARRGVRADHVSSLQEIPR
jgi:hypothetical protein